MAHTRSYFETWRAWGGFTVTGGQLTPEAPEPGEWVAIAGAGTASGVWQADESGLLPEVPDMSFTGTVWHLAPPADFLRLCDEIAAWQEKHPRTACLTETVGGYTRTMAQGRHGPADWTELFAPELARWRRMLTEVKL